MRFFWIASLILALSVTTRAEPFKPEDFKPITGMGVGSKASCGKWLEMRKGEGYIPLANWAFGFLTGISYESDTKDPLNNMDKDAVLYWLDNYCQGHPTEPFPMAVGKFSQFHPK